MAAVISIYCLRKDEGPLAHATLDDASRCREAGAGFVWVDLEAPTDEETMTLDERFAFHPLAIEDCRESPQYPKLDEYGSYVFLTMLAPDLLSVEQEDPDMVVLSLFLGADFVVTYHRRPLRAVTQLRARAERSGAAILGRGAAFLAFAIIDAIADQHDSAVRGIGDAAERRQDEILEEPRKETLDRILTLRSHVLQLKRILSDERNIMLKLSGGVEAIVGEEEGRYFSDVAEHFDRLGDQLEVSRDALAGARDLYLSVSANRTNEVVRALTIITTIMMPLTFVTSLYGMNVGLPGGASEGAGSLLTFFVLLGAMCAMAAGFFGYFKYRRWI